MNASMDQYTADVKIWLDGRFRLCDEEGVYIAHQPVYGFRAGHCEPGWMPRYAITLPILRTLARLPGRTFLDVGGAEGYKAWLARELVGLEVRSADLSAEACRRADELFGVASDEVDTHHLPYADGAFDLVLSSESIEHVRDYRSAVDELIRVARNAVVITVPREDPEVVRRNIAENVVHGHIHAFTTSSFDYLKQRGLRVVPLKILHPLTTILGPVLDAEPKQPGGGRRARFVYRAFNALTPVFRLLFGRRTAALLLTLDTVLCRWQGRHHGLVFVILKEGASLKPATAMSVTAGKLLNASVPLHKPMLH